jgi:hypothetical protein
MKYYISILIFVFGFFIFIDVSTEEITITENLTGLVVVELLLVCDSGLTMASLANGCLCPRRRDAGQSFLNPLLHSIQITFTFLLNILNIFIILFKPHILTKKLAAPLVVN